MAPGPTQVTATQIAVMPTEPARIETPRPAPTGTSSAPVTFTSSRYGYSLTMPPGWSIEEKPGAWNGENNDPGGEPGMDAYHQYLREADPPLTIGVLALKPGTTVQEWVQSEASRTTIRGCQPDPGLEKTSLAGEAGLIQRQTCQSLTVTNIFLVNKDRGYLLSWGGTPEGLHTFLEILPTFRFP